MYKWVILFGAFIVYMFDALEILILALALPSISADFGVTPAAAGLLATATLLGMGVGGPIIGTVADNRGRKFALVLCVVVFIVFTSLVYITPTLWIFIALRFVSGIGLGGVWSVISAFVAENWPEERRGVAVTFVLSAYPVGGLLAAQLSGFMLPEWREMFLLAGLSAIVPLLIVVFAFRESEEWLAARNQEFAKEAEHSQGKSSAIGEIFSGPYRRVTIIATLVSTFAFVAFYGSSTWLPSYLEVERGLDPRTVGMFMTWLNVGMFVGYNIFGYVADKFGKKFALLVAMIGAGVLMPLYGVVTNETALLLLGPAYAFFMTFAGLFGPYLAGIYPTKVRATGSGFCFNIGRGISAFAPLIFGALAAVASLAAGLVISGILFLVAAAMTALLPKDIKPTKKQSESKPADAAS